MEQWRPPKYDVLKKSLHSSSILITFKELWLYFASNSSACVKHSSKRTVKIGKERGLAKMDKYVAPDRKTLERDDKQPRRRV